MFMGSRVIIGIGITPAIVGGSNLISGRSLVAGNINENA